MDEIKNNDKNAFIRRKLSNLGDALEKQKIGFTIKDTLASDTSNLDLEEDTNT